MSHDDFDFEPIPGLPRRLPPGERILWQGAPAAGSFAWRFLRLPHLTGYFVALLGWVVVAGAIDGTPVREIAASAAGYGALALLALGLVWGYAGLVERTTVYTMTNRRLVIRAGIALPVAFNLPFSRIDGASMRAFPDGTGDIALALPEGQRIAYLALWPHARGFRTARPEPALRCVPDVRAVADALAQALAGGPQAAVAPKTRTAPAGEAGHVPDLRGHAA